MERVRRHDSKKIEDHVVDTAKFVELGAQDAPVENVNWDVQKAEVHSDPVEDSGTGPKVVIRRFNFQRPPIKEQLSHEELLAYHKKNTVIPMLWKDELELVHEPRIVAGKKGSFTIVAICSPRFVLGTRSYIHEDAVNVTQVINENSSRNTNQLH